MGTFDTAWLVAAVVAATPLVLAATGELVSQRAGVLNVGLEGMMLVGAFFGFLVADASGSWVVGTFGGLGAGVAYASIAAVLAIHARADQIVVGIGLNVLALAVTTFLFNEVFDTGSRIVLERPPDVAIPLLASVPVVGEALFDQQVLTYAAMAAAAAVWFVLGRTRTGLAIRAAGEAPAAVDAAGVSVARTRWLGTLVAGAGAGLGGAFLSIAQVGAFTQGMSAGRGFLALAAVIFGRWRPVGVVAACLLFGAADALQFRLQAQSTVPREVWVAGALLASAFVGYAVASARREGALAARAAGVLVATAALLAFAAAAVVEPDVQLPSQLWLALPYALSLVVLAGFVGRARMPSALALPYRRDED